jgi:hypothetical protein
LYKERSVVGRGRRNVNIYVFTDGV